MRNFVILLLTILSFAGFSQQGEIFTVVKVKGSIYNVTGKIPVNAGSVVSARDQLEFGSVDAEAIAISNTRGKFIIKQPADDLFGESIAMSSVDNSASPIASRSQYSVRAIEFRVDDLASYLGRGTFFIIGDSVQITFSPNTYPLSESKYFSVSFLHKGEDVSVDLVGNGQEVLFSRQSIFAPHLQEHQIDALSFYYLDATKQSIQKLATVRIQFIAEKDLLDEFALVANVLSSQGMDRKNMRGYMKQYMLDVYGNTDPTALQEFLTKVLAE